MALILSLPTQVTYGCISTSIGELCIFYISAGNKSDLHKSLDGRIKDCSPEKFVRAFSRYVCYPKDSLLEGECKPKLVVLTDEDIRKFDSSDLNNISKLFIENNKYLYTERIAKQFTNEEGKTVASSKDGEVIMPKEDSESWTEYLYRLSILELEGKNKQYKKIVNSTFIALQSAKEEIERIRPSLASNLAVTNYAKTILPQSSITEIAKATQSLASLSTLSDTLTAMREKKPLTFLSNVSETIASMKQRENQLFSQLTHAEHYLEGLAKQRFQTSTFIDQLRQDAFGNKAVQEMMLKQSTVFDGLASRVAEMNAAKFSIPQFSQAEMAWSMASSSLTSKMLDVGLLTQRERLSARLFKVPNTYSEFVRHTTDRLAADTTQEIAARLRGSLVLAEYQLLGISDTFNTFIVVPEDDEELDSKRILDAPFVQQAELLSCEFIKDENDTEALIAASPMAKTVEQARRVLQLVILCNEAGNTSVLNAEFFKPTTRLLEVYSDLPWISATDKRRFGDVVDCLYFIFYEGAGKDHLRFLKEHGGPLTDDKCDLIWCIKHLRNKWSRHDADHGKEKETRKSWAELSAKFRWLGLAKHPTDARHFQQLHYKLLQLAEKFLLSILNELKLE